MITGEELYKRRNERGWTLNQAAHALGIHRTTLWRYEMNQVQHINPGIEARIRKVYRWDDQEEESCTKGNTGENMANALLPEDMTEEEILRRYRRLDLRGKRRVQMLLKQG